MLFPSACLRNLGIVRFSAVVILPVSLDPLKLMNGSFGQIAVLVCMSTDCAGRVSCDQRLCISYIIPQRWAQIIIWWSWLENDCLYRFLALRHLNINLSGFLCGVWTIFSHSLQFGFHVHWLRETYFLWSVSLYLTITARWAQIIFDGCSGSRLVHEWLLGNLLTTRKDSKMFSARCRRPEPLPRLRLPADFKQKWVAVALGLTCS